MSDAMRWRVSGTPTDSVQTVTRLVEAQTREDAKQAYLSEIGHKHVRGLTAKPYRGGGRE